MRVKASLVCHSPRTLEGMTTKIIFLLFFLSPLTYSVPSDNAFFPWAKESRWVYAVTDKKKDKPFEMTVTMEDSWKDKDVSGMIMRQKDKRGIMREFLFKNEKGIFIDHLGLSK